MSKEILDMRLQRDNDGYSFDVQNGSGTTLASGWVRGNKADARREAKRQLSESMYLLPYSLAEYEV